MSGSKLFCAMLGAGVKGKTEAVLGIEILRISVRCWIYCCYLKCLTINFFSQTDGDI